VRRAAIFRFVGTSQRKRQNVLDLPRFARRDLSGAQVANAASVPKDCRSSSRR